MNCKVILQRSANVLRYSARKNHSRDRNVYLLHQIKGKTAEHAQNKYQKTTTIFSWELFTSRIPPLPSPRFLHYTKNGASNNANCVTLELSTSNACQYAFQLAPCSITSLVVLKTLYFGRVLCARSRKVQLTELPLFCN